MLRVSRLATQHDVIYLKDLQQLTPKYEMNMEAPCMLSQTNSLLSLHPMHLGPFAHDQSLHIV